MTAQTTAELLLEWDRRRPRSQQTELGMSELGECRRRVGYVLAGTEHTDDGGSVQAVLGTAVHLAVEDVFRLMQAAGVIPRADLVEHEVRFAGILGHLDRYDSVLQRIWDTKTTSSKWLDHIRLYGASLSNIWQASMYAAALIRSGLPVREIVIDYIARDTGDDYQVVIPFDPQNVRDALEWLKQVRETPLGMLSRDYAPDSSFCGNCPFRTKCWDGAKPNRDPRSVLYVEDPDGPAWAAKLEQARADKKDAEAREKEAKGALDALRPDETKSPVDVGYGKLLRWSVYTTHRLDSDAVRAEYEQIGAKPPENATSTVKLMFVPRKAEK